MTHCFNKDEWEISIDPWTDIGCKLRAMVHRSRVDYQLTKKRESDDFWWDMNVAHTRYISWLIKTHGELPGPCSFVVPKYEARIFEIKAEPPPGIELSDDLRKLVDDVMSDLYKSLGVL